MDIETVEKRTIFLSVVGSRAYGIHTATSDYDQVGVMIPPSKYFFGVEKFEQFRDFPGVDKVIYDIRKAVWLMMDNNPNMLDLLYTPDHCIKVMKPEWQVFVDNRNLFISKKCRHTFSGYAFAQLQRIKVHRKYLLDPPKNKPTREAFGLPAVSIFPTAQLKAIVYSALGDFLIEEDKENFLNELDEVYANYIMPIFSRYIKEDRRTLALEYLQVGVKSQANTLMSLGPSYIKEEYLEEARKELLFFNAAQDWKRYEEWSKNRNKARADLEVKFGFDTKHAAHLVRLIRMCVEILETGKVNVDRTHIDANELKAIRDGAWTYEQIEKYAQEMDNKAGELYKTSTLKKSPDSEKIKQLCDQVCEGFVQLI